MFNTVTMSMPQRHTTIELPKAAVLSLGAQHPDARYLF